MSCFKPTLPIMLKMSRHFINMDIKVTYDGYFRREEVKYSMTEICLKVSRQMMFDKFTSNTCILLICGTRNFSQNGLLLLLSGQSELN